LVPVAIWIYTLVFAFASLWFCHYCLAALQALRSEPGHDPLAPVPSTGAAPDKPAITAAPSASTAKGNDGP
jgi:hypothetical protein